jgi:hypothetical protein
MLAVVLKEKRYEKLIELFLVKFYVPFYGFSDCIKNIQFLNLLTNKKF